MKKKIIFLLFVCSVAMNIGFVVAYCFNRATAKVEAPQAHCPLNSEDAHLYKMLGLQPEQLKQIEPLAKNFHEQVNTLAGEIAAKRNRLMDEIARETVYMATLDKIYKDIATSQGKMQQLVMLHILDMKEIMTREQQRTFFDAFRHSFRIQNVLKQ